MRALARAFLCSASLVLASCAPDPVATQSSIALEPALASGSLPGWHARYELALGDRVEHVAAGDLDGDGFDELVAVTQTRGELCLWRGGPAGLVDLRPEKSPLGGFALKPCLLAAGAFGAGPTQRPLAVASRATREVRLLLLEGASWRELARVELDSVPRALASGDLDRDGSPELVWIADPDLVGVLTSSGERHAFPAGDELARCMGVWSDGTLSIGFQGSGRVRTFRFDGQRFELLGVEPCASLPRSLAEADLDGDGRPERLLVGGESALEIWSPGGTETRTSVTQSVPLALAVGDLDGDGRDDLAVGDFGDLRLEIFSAWRSGSATRHDSVYAGQTVTDVALGRFDGDAHLDLALANRDSNAVGLFRGAGGTATSAPSIAVGSFPASVVSADIDGDGDAEGLVLCAKSSNLALVDFEEGALELRDSIATGPAPHALALADVDGDLDLDALWVSGDAQGAHLEFALQTAAARLERAPFLDRPCGKSGESLLAADLDQDGLLDLAWIDADSGELRVELLAVRMEPGQRSPNVHALPLPGARCLVAFDLDGDAQLELAASTFAEGRAELRLFDVRSQSSGFALIETSRVPLRARAVALAAGDLDRDGLIDLVVLGGEPEAGTPGLVEGFRRNGKLGGALFDVLLPMPTGLAARHVAIVSSPATAHVLVAAQNSHVVNSYAYREYAGRQGLLRGPDLGAGLGVLAVAAGDADGDGQSDVWVANAFSDDLSLILDRAPR